MAIFRFRELDPSEFDAAGRLFVETYPHRAHEVRFWQGPASHERPSRWVAVLDPIPTLVGYAAIWHVERQTYRFDVMVDPAWRGRGIGTGHPALLRINTRFGFEQSHCEVRLVSQVNPPV